MHYWFKYFFLIVFVVANPSNSEDNEDCGSHCVGKEYECIKGQCYCAEGYITNYFMTDCVKCPEFGEKCFGKCCNSQSNTTLHCWHGICQPCYDGYGSWNCKDTVDQVLLVYTAQVIMGIALILGIIATLVLLFKLCAAATLRPLGHGSNCDSRLSIGSLQLYIEERLRDAPPRYSRATPSIATIQTAPPTFHNECFIHDSSIPPPPYTEEIKTENSQNTAVHI